LIKRKIIWRAVCPQLALTLQGARLAYLILTEVNAIGVNVVIAASNLLENKWWNTVCYIIVTV